MSAMMSKKTIKIFPFHKHYERKERKDPIVQLEANKSSIKDLFNNLLDETKGFKYLFLKVLSIWF